MKIIISYLETESSPVSCLAAMLKNAGHLVKCIPRVKASKSLFKHSDMVISLGGDGTFLRNSRYLEDTPILGINPNPKEKEGFFTAIDLADFSPEKLQKFKILELPRLSCKINGKLQQHLAVNEIYFGKRKSWHVAEYELALGKRQEFQRSSGVIVTTGAGSTAWYHSAGGKPFSILQRNVKFVVREPYRGRINHPSLTSGSLGKLRIISKMDDGILVVDSFGGGVSLPYNSEITIQISKPLRVMSFKAARIRW